ncbi:MAG TPA: hypothetical protein VEK08_24915 [Planctomycetota bacterium]|nr:hypothetical protein [Planctomycetota bacterium]
MSSDRIFGFFCSTLFAASAWAGDAAPPPPPPPPPPQIQPVKPVPANPAPANPMMIADLRPYLNDFQTGTPEQQKAAAKVLLECGNRAYAALAPLLKHTVPDIVTRANELRQQIDTQSLKMYRDVEGERQKLAQQPLTVEALEKMRQSWINLATYASQPALRQFGVQNANEINKTIESVKNANQQLQEYDKQLAAAPDVKGLTRAQLQLERATALKILQRDNEALAAAQDAAASSGKTGRHTPAALKLQAEIQLRREDAKGAEASCRAIIADHPRSLETKFAHKTLLNLLSGAQRYDEAVAHTRAYLTAFPVDEEAQEEAYSLMDTLMDDEQDYKRVAALTDVLLEVLPVSRLRPDVPKLSGGCSEYVLKDYNKALKGYTMLREQFVDAVDPNDMAAAVSRLQAKIAGTFPREPQESEPGAAGALARFLKAIRTRDEKLIATAVVKDEVEDYVDLVKEGGDEKVPALTFADFVIRKIDLDEKAGTAKLQIDFYEAGSSKPRPLTQHAVKEGETWKIKWEDLEEAAELEAPQLIVPTAPGSTPTLQPGKPK